MVVEVEVVAGAADLPETDAVWRTEVGGERNVPVGLRLGR